SHLAKAMTRTGAILGMLAAQAGIAVPAGRDGTGDDALAFGVAGHGRPQLLYDADRLVADRQALLHGILAAQDVDVGATDRGRGNPHQGVERADIGDRLGLEDDTSRLDENSRFHCGHRDTPVSASGTSERE